jgi:hypothetical protein
VCITTAVGIARSTERMCRSQSRGWGSSWSTVSCLSRLRNCSIDGIILPIRYACHFAPPCNSLKGKKKSEICLGIFKFTIFVSNVTLSSLRCSFRTLRYPQAFVRQVKPRVDMTDKGGATDELVVSDRWQMFIAFSNNKEDIWVASVDLPLD